MSNKILERFREYINTSQFNSIRIGLASPEKIRALSYGEVKKIETINYRTLKPERDGLFCARIFGPVKDWECNCGKYKRMKHRGVTCEKCGVEVIQARVRRERMGHINLVSPVCHIWYLKGIPSYLSIVLEMTVRDLESITYFDSYVVIQQGNSPYPQKTLLSSQEYNEYATAHPEDIIFKARMGAEALRELLMMMDLNFEVRKIEEDYKQTTSVALKHKLARQFKILSGALQSNIRPEWIIMEVLPVIPPDLRPLVPLEGGRFASSDLNDLYRRVLNRNIRLRRLIELEAPDVIIKNEKRMLQEAVDALIDNGRRGQPVRGSNRRPLKSLSEMLRGKQGRFRQNLLGKRVDYSGRSVIVVDPELSMHQCGIPKIMALELFKPYVYVELQHREIAPNLRVAKRMVEEMTPEVWETLEAVVRGRPILLNRAPTLHRLGIQAFYPILVEGKAIKIHPLVCTAFNADFDGDQMAVHVLLSRKAIAEAERLMLATTNILSPASGKPITVPSQDMVLGLYYITKGRKNTAGENLTFADIDEVIYAYQRNKLDIHAHIHLRLKSGRIVDTTVGRVLLYEKLPKNADFEWVNHAMKKKNLTRLVANLFRRFGTEKTVHALDKIKKLGFSYATYGGLSLSIEDLVIPESKSKIINKSVKEVEKLESLYMDGAITNGERENKVIQVWSRATDDVANAMINALDEQDTKAAENQDKSMAPFNPVFMMLDSGARSSKQQIRQLGGMRGLMNKPSGEIMETPVLANFKEGLSVFEYFISTHGARKGLADTALKTADSGYLTRRLVDVAQDVVVTQHDCKSLGYISITALRDAGNELQKISSRAFARVTVEDIVDPVTAKIIAKAGDIITSDVIEKLDDSAVSVVHARSLLTCQTKRGVCALCYGLDLATHKLVDIGTAVGIVAAQSIGEPGTQLTMRTFHIGGTVSGLAEQSYYTAKSDGTIEYQGVHAVQNKDGVWIVMNRKSKIAVVADDGRELEVVDLEYGSHLLAQDKQKIHKGDKIAEWELHHKIIMAEAAGTVQFVDLIENVTYQEQYDEAVGVASKIVLERKEEKRQPCITILTSEQKELKYFLPTGALIQVTDGAKVVAGAILAKMVREEQKTKDIVGGLPRVAELFEARVPKDVAILCEADGIVQFGGLHRGQRRINVINKDGEVSEYNIPRSKHLNVEDGQHVGIGDQLTAGMPNVHDILRILGPEEAQRYLIREVQKIYTLQGVTINDKHIELIVRQMLRKVRVVDPGETNFIVGDRIDKVHLQEVNAIMTQQGKKISLAKPMLMGITKASLGTESFISAASFQETTRILTEAAITGQVDHLYGLKENVIIGKLIPAGTGVESFEIKHLGEDISDIEQEARNEEQLEISLESVTLSQNYSEKNIGT